MITKKITPKKSRFQNAIFFILALGLIIYTSSRAALLSLTCDEASTYFSHVPNSIWSCFFSESCWSDANNHLLNTFLMQLSVGAFGISELTLRAPNLLGHFIYLIFSILLVRRYSNNFWISLAGFCLLNLNPFLIEFFSLARGYGLGVGWMMMSVYFLFRWVDSEKLNLGMYCYVGAFLAVLSNFIFLNYWASATAIFGFFILGKYFFWEKGISKGGFLKSFLLPILASLILFFLIKNPIQFLQSKGEFVYGAENLAESFVGMVKLSVMSQGYFNPFTTNVFILFYFLKNKENTFAKIYVGGVGLMILMLLAMVVQYFLLDVKYLVGRKSVMLLPFFGLSVYLFLEFLFREKSKKWTIGFAILISDGKIGEEEKINLGVFWIYGPASEFYQEYFLVEKIGKVTRFDEEDFEEMEDFDFIYVREEDVKLIEGKYILEKEFGRSGVLFKKKK